MRIVDVCAFYAPQGGGVKTYVERKLRAAERYGIEMVILAPGAKDDIIAREGGGFIQTVKAPIFPLDTRYRYFQDEEALHRTLDQLAPDLVEVSSPWGSPAIVARWNSSVPRALVMHADPLAAYAYRWFSPVASRERIDRGFDWFWRHLRNLDQQYDFVVCASDQLGQRLSQGGLSKVTTIPMGVEPGIFSPALRDEALRERLLGRCGLRADATLLLALGRHASEKRWPMVFEAVTAAGYASPVGLILFGDGRNRKKVVRAAANNPHIHLAAPVSDRQLLATIMASADALVHGCEAETFCMAAAEAKASGLPLIVPDEGGASDQFVTGQGERYASRDPVALAQAIQNFIRLDPAAQRRAASGDAPHCPTMDEHFKRLFELYRGSRKEMTHAA